MRRLLLLLASLLCVSHVCGQTVTGSGRISGTGTIGIIPVVNTSIGWTSVPNTAWTVTCPAGNFGNCDGLVDAWGSGVADTAHNTLLFLGGGHCDYFGNQIVKFDLVAGTITLLDQPSSQDGACTTPEDTLGDGTPSARHWYDGLTYDPGNGTIIGFGGAPQGPGFFVNTVWAAPTSSFSPASTGAGIWANKAPTLSGGALQNLFGNIAAYDITSDAIWMMEQAKFPGQLWKYTRLNNTLTLMASYNSGSPPNIDDGDESGAIDTNNQVMYIVGHGVFLKVSIATGSAFALNPVNGTNCNTPGSDGKTAIGGSYPGVAFNPSDGSLAIWQGGSNVWIYNPATNTCTQEIYTGGPTTQAANGTFGRFRYFPGLGKYAVCNSRTENCFTLQRGPVNGWLNRINGVNVPGGQASIVSSQSFDTFPATTKQQYFQLFKPAQITTNCSIAADGCSLQIHMNPGDFQGEPGWFNYNFNAALTALYGQNSEFYVQFKARHSASFLSPATWTNFTDFKLAIFSEGDSNASQAGNCSNTPTDFVLDSDSNNTPYRPFIYENCGADGTSTVNFLSQGFAPIQLANIAGGTDLLDQDAAGGPHYGPTGGTGSTVPRTDPTEWNFVADQFATYQVHLKYGTNGVANSVVDVWAAHPGQPSVLIVNAGDIGMNDKPLNSSVTDKFGKVVLLPYATGATWQVASDVYYDDLIISNRRLPDPETGVPNAPELLTWTASAGHPLLAWRVNSQNGTPQDDTGFLIERCTGTAQVCLPNPQSGFTQIGTTAPGASTFSDSTSVTGTTYTYRVRAKNASGNSAYAVSVCFNGLPNNNCSTLVAP